MQNTVTQIREVGFPVSKIEIYFPPWYSNLTD